MSILITGIAGGLAQQVARLLVSRGEDVIGVDYRPTPELGEELRDVRVYRASYHKTAIEDVFRKHAIGKVLHLGREGNLSKHVEHRFETNVVGSQKILAMCLAHRVERLVVLSTFHIYGAHPRNHTPISEADPLRAGTDFPEIADAIQLDNMASTWVFQHPGSNVVVLRPTNVVGPTITNTMSKFLRLPHVPYLLGFNPMMQFIHSDDLANAIVATVDKPAVRGVFNVAGPVTLPWRTALELAAARTVPVPASLVTTYMRLFSKFPEYLTSFYKYPCVITDAAFRRELGWEPKVSIRETLRSTVAHARQAQSE